MEALWLASTSSSPEVKSLVRGMVLEFLRNLNTEGSYLGYLNIRATHKNEMAEQKK